MKMHGPCIMEDLLFRTLYETFERNSIEELTLNNLEMYLTLLLIPEINGESLFLIVYES